MRWYIVGTPMKTLAAGSRATTAAASKRANHSIGLPPASARCAATHRPCTWCSGSAWISTSPPGGCGGQCQAWASARRLLSRLSWLSIAPLLRPVLPAV